VARILDVGVRRCDTPAAGPAVVVAAISRAADHCVTGLRQHDETFGRLNPEHLVEIFGWHNLARAPVFDIESVEEVRLPACRFQ
jgi:hypothetical protein